jgi:hypothetical protein
MYGKCLLAAMAAGGEHGSHGGHREAVKSVELEAAGWGPLMTQKKRSALMGVREGEQQKLTFVSYQQRGR